MSVKKIYVGMMMIAATFSACLLKTSVILADTTAGSFSVGTVFSEHQTDKSNVFFDIRWTPGATDTFGVRITNSSDQDQAYIIKTGKARTTATGTIDYANGNKEVEAKKYKFASLLKIAQEVQVPAHASAVVQGTVAFPNEAYNGILLGGINVSEKKVAGAENSATVSNVISYTVPLVLRGNNDVRPPAKVDFQVMAVKRLSATAYAVNTKIINVEPTLLNDATFTAEVKNAAGKVVTTQKDSIDITPETEFEYPIQLRGDYPAGKYDVSVKLAHGKDTWTSEKQITINQVQAKRIETIKPKPKAKPVDSLQVVVISLILGIFILSTLVFGLVCILVKKRKNQTE